MIGDFLKIVTLAAAVYVGFRLFRAWSVKDMNGMKIWGAALAALALLQVFVILPLGSVRLDEDSNKLLTESTTDSRTKARIFRAKYKDPESFQDYVFVYDPAEVYFDSFSVNYMQRKDKRNSGPRTDRGEVFPEDRSKRMISLPAAAGRRRTYRQPNSSRDEGFLVSVIVQFFLERGDRSEGDYQDKLEKFNAISTKGQFMVMRDGRFEEVERSPRRYR